MYNNMSKMHRVSVQRCYKERTNPENYT